MFMLVAFEIVSKGDRNLNQEHLRFSLAILNGRPVFFSFFFLTGRADVVSPKENNTNLS